MRSSKSGKITKRLTSLLTAGVLTSSAVFSGAGAGLFAVASADKISGIPQPLTAKAIVAGEPALQNSTGNIAKDEHIYFGQPTSDDNYWYHNLSNDAQSTTPYWRVLSSTTNNKGETGGIFVLSEYLWSGITGNRVDGDVQFNNSNVNTNLGQTYVNDWQGSTAQSWCKNFYNGDKTVFRSEEQSAILAVSTTDANNETLYDHEWGTESGKLSLDNDHVFFLSAREAHEYLSKKSDNTDDYNLLKALTWNNEPGHWWLRSPNFSNNGNNGEAGFVDKNDGYGVPFVHAVAVADGMGARPAFNINQKAVLFASAAVNGKVSGDVGPNALYPVSASSNVTDWKLTLLDNGTTEDPNGHKNFQASFASKTGNVIKVNVSGVKQGEIEYISAIIKDSEGTIKYYGRITNCNEVPTSVDIDLTGKFNEGDSLFVFNEEYNDDYMTDYSSKLIGIPVPMLTVTYDANGADSGTAPTDATLYAKNASVTLKDNGGNLTKTGKVFGGWNTKADGTGTTYAREDTFTITANTTLYAYWTTGSVTLNKTNTTLPVGGTETLTATTVPARLIISWSSDKEGVATVDANGIVTAVAPGTANITAKFTEGGTDYTATCAVTVSDGKVTGITLNKTETGLIVGGSETLVPTFTPEDAADKTLVWSSDKESVVTVDANGKITGIAPGTAVITVTATNGTEDTADDVKAVCTVTVSDSLVPVTSITLSKAEASLIVGSTEKLTAEITPKTATHQDLVWTSGDPSIATVDENGQITAVAPGTVTITVTATNGTEDTSDDVSVTCKVTVITVNNGNTKPIPVVFDESCITPELIAAGYATVDLIRAALERRLEVKETEQRENSLLMDVRLQISTDGGATWHYATDDEIRAMGSVFVLLPYPPGTNPSDYVFSVAHMIGTTNGEVKAGTIETPATQNTADGILTQFAGLSPVLITWTKKAASAKTSEEEQKPPHRHNFVWKVTREATETLEGELSYMCDSCGYVEYIVPLSAYYVFQQNVINKIRGAAQGAIVEITTDLWISFHRSVADALKERPDVTLVVNFLDEGYRGNRKRLTIPANTDLLSLFGSDNFAGFLFLGGKLGLTE